MTISPTQKEYIFDLYYFIRIPKDYDGIILGLENTTNLSMNGDVVNRRSQYDSSYTYDDDRPLSEKLKGEKAIFRFN